jgi:hypothetical protein
MNWIQIKYCTVKKEKTKEKEIIGDSGRNHYMEYSLSDLTWLGKAEVNMEVDEKLSAAFYRCGRKCIYKGT